MKKNQLTIFLALVAALLIVACRQQEDVSITPENEQQPPAAETAEAGTSEAAAEAVAASETATPAPTPTDAPPTPTPRPPKDLVVCMSQEPRSLYLYDDNSLAATAVRHALYESPVTSRSYDYQAQGLVKLPSLDDGDALLEIIEVGEGSRVVSASGRPTTLTSGISVVNAAGEVVAYDGSTPIQMTRMTVDFTFQPLVWSDGTPVTADDSVFSFEVAADRETPRPDTTVDLTESYTALDELSVRWVGLPGFLDNTYFNNVWTPLPRHQLESFTAVELLTAPEATQLPLSHGPFVVEEWVPGQSIRLVPNENYYRAAEGLPHLSSLTFRFFSREEVANPARITAEIAGGCHVLTNDLVTLDALPGLVEAEANGDLIVHSVNGEVFEHIVFGVNPVFAYANNRPDWFEDVRVRQAIALCTNRQRLADELMGGRVTVMDTFVPNEHPLHPTDAAQWPYDPERANSLLDEVGYLDADGDGIRQDIEAGVPFSITLGTDNASPLRSSIIERVREDLAACGINANTYTRAAGAWFAEGPVGPLFGRRFDLAQFAWVNRIQPDCTLYLSSNIPGPVEEGFGGWNNVNVSGWANEAYDAACRQAQTLLPGTPGYEENHRHTMRLFAQELPALPLFPSVKAAVTSLDVLNFQLDPTQPSALWNVAELDMELGG